MRAGMFNTIGFLMHRKRTNRTCAGYACAAVAFLAVSLLSSAFAQTSLLQATEKTQKQGVNRRPAEAAPSEEAAAPEEAREPTLLAPTTALDRLIDRTTYRLGPGDRLSLGLWGPINKSFALVVTPEGDLLVPAVGPVHVAYLTIAEAERRIVAAGANAYQNARLTLSLTEVRTFRVHVTGLVEKPGTYLATPADRVSTIVQRAGGFMDNASYRRIRLDRSDAPSLSADLQLFYAAGDTSLNPTLEMGDVVTVPARGDSVAIWGAVQVPGNYEYRPGDTVSKMIQLAGGLTDDAAMNRVEWTAFPVDSGPPVVRTIDLSNLTDSPADNALRPGDRLLIQPLPNWRLRQAVTVEGEARFPGEYSIVEGQTRLSEVLRRAGGLTPEASLTTSRLVRSKLQETPDPEYERLSLMRAAEMNREEYAYFRARSREIRGHFPIDMGNALANPGGPDDMTLVDRDSILISRKPVTVEVAGQVARPGLIAYQPGRTVDFYIEQAGGLSWNARYRGIRVIKAETGLWVKPTDNAILEPGDTIFVPEKDPTDWWEITKEVIVLTSQVITTIFIVQSIARGK